MSLLPCTTVYKQASKLKPEDNSAIGCMEAIGERWEEYRDRFENGGGDEQDVD